MSFVQFADELDIPLSPVQRVAVKLAFDRVEPRDLEGEEWEIGQRLLKPPEQAEPVETVPASARRVLTLVKGGRIGGTYVFGAVYCCWRALTADLSTLAPGEKPRALLGAPDLDLAEQALTYAKGVFGSDPELAEMVLVNTTKKLVVERPDGRQVEILPRAAAKGGKAFRSRTLVCAVLSEVAFFEDSTHAVNDADCFAAVNPRVLPGGLTVLESTPWAESGLLHDEFSRNHGKPDTSLAMHAPTLFALPTERNQLVVEAELKRDPENAEREFGAKFLPIGAVKFFDARAVDEAIDDTLFLPAKRAPFTTCVVGADLGFVRNASVGVPVERGPERYRVLDIEERIPGRERLKPSMVFAGLMVQADQAQAEEIAADAHYSESAREAFHGRPSDAGPPKVFIQTPSGQEGKATMFNETRRVFNEGLMKIPRHPRLIEQLKAVIRKPLPGGGMAISSPLDAKGTHGDIVSALCAGVWRLSILQLPEGPAAPLPEDTLAREAELWRQRRAERREREAKRAEEGWAYAPTLPEEEPWVR